MKLIGEFVFDGPQAKVWELLQDPDVLASALPGTKQITMVSENEYEAEMKIQVGPIVGLFSGRISISDVIPINSYTLTVEGKGKAGFLNGTGQIQLIDQGEGKTLMEYQGDVQIGGKLASVGQRLIEVTSKSIIKKGLETINKTYLTPKD